MEVNMTNGNIIQIHGRGNCSAPTDVRKFAESFVSAVVPKVKNDKRRKTA
jgi:hypothetical protein